MTDLELFFLGSPEGFAGPAPLAQGGVESSSPATFLGLAIAFGLFSLLAAVFVLIQVRARQAAEAKAKALEEEAKAMAQKESSATQDSQSRFRHLLEVTPLGIFEADSLGQYAFVSHHWRDLVGLETQQAKGDGWLAAVKSEDGARVGEAWRRAVEQGLPFECEWPVAEGGKASWVHCRATPRRNPHDGTLAYIGTLNDISDRKRRELEQRQLDESAAHNLKLESLGVMAGGIAHDFNNLLVGVLGNTELLRMHVEPGSTDQLELLGRIEGAARRAADLAQQMLVFAGAGVVELQSVDLFELVEESLSLFSEGERARICSDLARGLPTILADRTRIQQIVTNLVKNALEASENQKGQVVVRTEVRTVTAGELEGALLDSEFEPGEAVVLEVRDEGCGIGEGDLSRIFDPFFSTKFAGRGLGLGVVAGAVRANHACLIVESEPGGGTTMRVLLEPAESLASTKVEETEPELEGAKHGNLLVVDDEEMVRETLRSILERAGYTVTLAEGGEQALERLRVNSEPWDAVLLDMTMPGMNGRETLRAMRELDKTIPVLLLSGHAQEELEREFADDDLAGYVLKPFRAAGLLRSVASVLPRAQRETPGGAADPA